MVSLPDFPIALKEESVGQEQVRNQAAQAEPETESEEPSHPLLGENRHQGSPILPGKQGHRRRSESPFEGRFRHFPGRLERRPAQEKRRPGGGQALPGHPQGGLGWHIDIPSHARSFKSSISNTCSGVRPLPPLRPPSIRDNDWRISAPLASVRSPPSPPCPRRRTPPGSPPRRSRCARRRRRGASPSLPGTGGNPLRPIAPGKRPLPRTVPSPPRPPGKPHKPPWVRPPPPHREMPHGCRAQMWTRSRP